jgi:hypothetical protein
VNGDIAIGGVDALRLDGANAYLFPWSTGRANNTVVVGGGASTNLSVAAGSIGGSYALTPSYSTFGQYGQGDGGAAIYNENNAFKTLMIIGNNSAGGTRHVGLWDDVTVNGNLQVNGTCNGGPCTSSGTTLYFTVTGCAIPAGGNLQSCNGTANLPQALADANYTLVCTPNSLGQLTALSFSTGSKTSTNFTYALVKVMSDGYNNSFSPPIDCVAHHS